MDGVNRCGMISSEDAITLTTFAVEAEEINEIVRVLSPLPVRHRYSFRASAVEQIIIPVIEIGLGSAILWFAKGFFEEAGKDLYRKLRKPLKETIDKSEAHEAILRVKVDSEGVEVDARINLKNEEEGEGSLETIEAQLDFLKEEITKEHLPSKPSSAYFVYNTETRSWEPEGVIFSEPFSKLYYHKKTKEWKPELEEQV
jgi:hypothetical protein